MTIMGDWAQGYFTSIGLTADQEYGWAPSPGTDGVFMMLSDSFGLPQGAPHRNAAVEWLTVAGSREGQDAFNPLKGSIPARTDGDRSLYDVYLLSAMDDFASNDITPSLAHGAAASEGWVTGFNDVMTLFVSDLDTAAAQQAMSQACEDAGVCGEGMVEPAPETGGAAGELEIFSWWTAGGEADGLNAMYEVLGAAYPDVEIINATVAGGAGSNAKAVLATRMQAGDPPDSFQVHAGHELIDTWVVADKMEPVTFIFEDNDWLDSYPPGVIDVLSSDGEIWSVPVNIHRSNVTWYNSQIFADMGLEVPDSFDDFFAVAEALQTEGVTPLALGDNGIWAATHLFEDVLLGSMGPDAYRGLWTGETDWNGPEVTEALENFAGMMAYVNEDHAALSWDQAAQLVADGDAAMTIMGDWAQGYFTSIGLEPMSDYGWAPSPGTNGVFMMLSDTFGLPAGAPHREAAIAWLTIAGSREGQDAFNPLNGNGRFFVQ
jgi:glucose/mannose transport system substrate-binding protein